MRFVQLRADNFFSSLQVTVKETGLQLTQNRAARLFPYFKLIISRTTNCYTQFRTSHYFPFPHKASHTVQSYEFFPSLTRYRE